MGKATRPRVYARIRPMFGRDAGQPELFKITNNSLEYRKSEGEPHRFRTRANVIRTRTIVIHCCCHRRAGGWEDIEHILQRVRIIRVRPR